MGAGSDVGRGVAEASSAFCRSNRAVQVSAPDDAVHLEVVVFLERLHGVDGLVHVIAADRAGEIVQFGQALLNLLHAVALRAAGEFPVIFDIIGRLLRIGAVRRDDDVVDIAKLGGLSRLASAKRESAPSLNSLRCVSISAVPVAFQPVLFLEQLDAEGCAFQIIAADLPVIVLQCDQAFLNALHIVAGIAGGEHPIFRR